MKTQSAKYLFEEQKENKNKIEPVSIMPFPQNYILRVLRYIRILELNPY